MSVKLSKINPNEIMGYEPYFGKEVVTGFINHESKTIRPTHGYFPPHRHGVENVKYAKDLGYKFISE